MLLSTEGPDLVLSLPDLAIFSSPKTQMDFEKKTGKDINPGPQCVARVGPPGANSLVKLLIRPPPHSLNLIPSADI